MKVVISLTTMPDKYSKLPRTLESLHRQTLKPDAIYLSLPKVSRRLGTEYPPVPAEVTNLCTVVPCGDFGPITKILGGLLAENDPETVIITFDDDMVYPETIVEKLVARHKQYPEAAIGSSGMLVKYPCPMCAITPNEDNFLYRIPKFQIPAEGRRVDSIYGYPGALYVRKFFPAKEKLEADFLNYALVNHDMLMNDDIVISGYLSMQKVERRIFPNMPEVSFVLDEKSGVRTRTATEISYNLDHFFQRMNRAIETAKSIGMYSTTEPMDMSESIIGVSLIIVLVALIIVVLAVYLVQSPLYFQTL
jgi:hypothetical protein